MPKCDHIIVADSEEAIRDSLEMVLKEEGYDCRTAADRESLVATLSDYRPDLIISDVVLIRGQADEILSHLEPCNQSQCILITLTYERIGEMFDLLQHDITEYLLKPFQFEELLERIEKMLVSAHGEVNGEDSSQVG